MRVVFEGRWDTAIQPIFDLIRIVSGGHAHTVGNAENMGVYGNGGMAPKHL